MRPREETRVLEDLLRQLRRSCNEHHAARPQRSVGDHCPVCQEYGRMGLLIDQIEDQIEEICVTYVEREEGE